jgi:photosystem II stability/assembly factor-like uncharacterized protein
VLFKTSDYGKTWEKISPDLSREHTGQPASLAPLPAKEAERRRGAIYSVAASFQDVNTIWAGTDDGLVWVTRDGGKNWKNITPPGMIPWSKVTQISASHFDDKTAYVSVSRFRIDDLHPYIYRTHDGGATWQQITTGLPDDSPVNTVREDPVRKGMLFAGTETAVWTSLDDGDHWQPLQYSLPHTSMRDLWIHENDLIVATHGRAFWILDDISPLRQLEGIQAKTEPILFKPGAAYRVRRDTNTDTPLPPDEPAGQNPPDGAAIDYSLPESTEGPVTLEILDPAGNVVRRYSSTDKPEQTLGELKKQLIPLYWIRMPQVLPASAGMHRWVWDLRYATPTATHYEYPIAAVPQDTPRTPQGPLALPGPYQVRLTANGKTMTVPLTVKMDPRVISTRTDLEILFNLEHKLAGMVTSSAEAALEAHSIREQVEKLSSQGASTLKVQLEQADKQLEELLSGKEGNGTAERTPGLDDVAGEIEGLYGEVGQVDAAPTAAQQSAETHLSTELSDVLRAWNQLKNTVVPELNHKLGAEHLPALNENEKPANMPESGDED